MAEDIFDKLDWRATGGHPDHGTPDPIFREAADAILLLRHDLGKLAGAAAGVMQASQSGKAPDFAPLMAAYQEATKRLARKK